MCLSTFKLMVTVGLSNHGSFLFTIFLIDSVYIVGKLVMHPCVSFRSGASPVVASYFVKVTELQLHGKKVTKLLLPFKKSN